MTKKTPVGKTPTPQAQPLKWPRSDKAALLAFDARTKICTGNCGQHRDDPRSFKEMKFQCPECQEVPLAEVLDSDEECAARYRFLREHHALELLKICPAPRPWHDAEEVVDEAIDRARLA